MMSNFDRFSVLQMVSIFLYRFLRTKPSLGNLAMQKFWCESKSLTETDVDTVLIAESKLNFSGSELMQIALYINMIMQTT